MLSMWLVQTQVNANRQLNHRIESDYISGMQLLVFEDKTYDSYLEMLNILWACMTLTYFAMTKRQLAACTDGGNYYVVIFYSTLSMSDQISSVSKSCFLSIRYLRRIRNTLDISTARTITTSLIHSKLDYCNSLFLNLPQSQLGSLQLIFNSSARAVSKTPKFAHISPVFIFLPWLKIEQRIHYKVASITYKVLQSEQPSYLHSLLIVQSNRTTHSSDVITLQQFAHVLNFRVKLMRGQGKKRKRIRSSAEWWRRRRLPQLFG